MEVGNNDTENNAAGGSNAKPIPQPILQKTIAKHGLPTPAPSPDARIYPEAVGLIREYVEMWDYAGGARFRGFVAEQEDMRSMLVFFDKEVIGMDLKTGLMSLLELSSSEYFDCEQLVISVDRTADEEEVQELTKSLGWVGFELTMLEDWAADGCISDRYIFLKMDT